MSEKIKYDREKFRKSLNRMFAEMGIPLPERISPHEVTVYDDDGSIIGRYWLGKDLKKEDNDG